MTSKALPPQRSPSIPVRVEVARAMGRPMLSWVGKRPLREVQAFPSQLVERFAPDTPNGIVADDVDWTEWPERFDRGGLLFHGDNKEVLAHLLATGFRGKVDLVYIDPPFDSGADYVRKVQLRGASGSARLDGETYTLGEQIQYTDIWANDTYLQFMYERLLLIRELVSETGWMVLHADWHKSHQLRVVSDEVFGAERLVNEVVWKRTGGRSDSRFFNHIHDTLLIYSKGDSPTFNEQYTALDPRYVERYFSFRDADDRRFAAIDATQAGLRRGPSGQAWRGFDPATRGNHWKFGPADMDRLDGEGRVYWPEEIGLVRSVYGDDALRAVLADAPQGVFDQRSWNYWHLMLDRSPAPPLPRRRL